MLIVEPSATLEWITPNAAEVIERAGRTCYKSEWKIESPICADGPYNRSGSAPIEGSAPKFIEMITKRGHLCFDADTEVLSSDGWVLWPDVTGDHLLCTCDPDSHVIDYQKPLALTEEPYSGRMYRIHGKQIDALVTPNHRLLVCPTTTREGRRKDRFDLLPVVDLGSSSYAMLKSGVWAFGGDATPLPVCRLLGFAIGDGYKAHNRKPVVFHLRKERKILFLRRESASAGWGVTERKNDTFVLHVPEMYQDMFRGMYSDTGYKVIPQGLLTSWSAEQLTALYEGLLNSDGYIGRTYQCYDTNSEELAGQFQQLMLHVGLASNISQAQSYAAVGNYRNYIIRRELKPEVNKFSGSMQKSEWIEDWSGVVYCATVPNKTLYVRRNGKAYWSGNSVLEHASASFRFITDRGVTHEMVRHRIVSVSQESTRFCNYSKDRFGGEIQVIEPPYKGHATDARRVWKEAVEFAEDAYLKLLALGQPPQIARSVLPTCLKTEIVMTCNFRIWLHIFSLRTDDNPAAHPQIQEVMNLARNILRVECPAVFR